MYLELQTYKVPARWPVPKVSKAGVCTFWCAVDLLPKPCFDFSALFFFLHVPLNTFLEMQDKKKHADARDRAFSVVVSHLWESFPVGKQLALQFWILSGLCSNCFKLPCLLANHLDEF